MGPIPQITIVVIPEQHFPSAGIDPRAINCYPWDLSSSTISRPRGELATLSDEADPSERSDDSDEALLSYRNLDQ